MLVSKLCNNASRTSPPRAAFVLEAPMRNNSAAVLPSLLPVLPLVSNGQRRRPNDYDSSTNSQIQICYETGCRVVIRAAKLKFVAENKTRVYLAQKCLTLQHCVLLRDKLVTKVVIGGFHVTQVSLIITQVKNKIAYHLIN